LTFVKRCVVGHGEQGDVQMILRRFDSWPMGNPRSPTVTVRRVHVEGDGLLREWGHAVTTAAAYAEAVAALDAQRFDLLISDIGLPDGSGVDLMKEVRTPVTDAGHRPERIRARRGPAAEPGSGFHGSPHQAGQLPSTPGSHGPIRALAGHVCAPAVIELRQIKVSGE